MAQHNKIYGSMDFINEEYYNTRRMYGQYTFEYKSLDIDLENMEFNQTETLEETENCIKPIMIKKK
jgi:hypothetical protein